MIATLEQNWQLPLSATRPVVSCLDRVSKSYGNLALHNLTFRLQAGELVAVLG
jgi:hypothetical protein